MQICQTGLARTEKLARPTQPQIRLGDLEAIVLSFDGAQTLGGKAVDRAAIDQQTISGRRASSNPAAQLMQLR
jgi:hypothetical protein